MGRRGFDWSDALFGTFLLRVAYVGTPYHGLAHQKPTSHRHYFDRLSDAKRLRQTRQDEQDMTVLHNSKGGLESGAAANELATVEGVIVNALKRANLIVSREDSEISRCGRTDKGVHARANYISLRMRLKERRSASITSSSNAAHQPQPQPQPQPQSQLQALAQSSETCSDFSTSDTSASMVDEALEEEWKKLAEKKREFQSAYDYQKILNSLLPRSIRITEVFKIPSWFDARFHCLYRSYKYFFPLHYNAKRYQGNTPRCEIRIPDTGSKPRSDKFTLEGGHPEGSHSEASHSEGSDYVFGDEKGVRRKGKYESSRPRQRLNLDRMNLAAASFLGQHDFKNFSKVEPDSGKTTIRRVLHCSVEALDDETGVCKVMGPAFLWHQVRNMVAVLLLVGQGELDPSVVRAWLDCAQTPVRPPYTMAPANGLVLWDCVFEHQQHLEPTVTLDAPDCFEAIRKETLTTLHVLAALQTPS